MKDVLAHTRAFFHIERVIAGPIAFYAISRQNLAIGPIRDSLEQAELDADKFYSINENMPLQHVGHGACI